MIDDGLAHGSGRDPFGRKIFFRGRVFNEGRYVDTDDHICTQFSSDPHRNWKWYWRNPLHNFTFYVIGIADKTHIRTGKYPKRVFAPGGGWNRTVSKYKLMRLPFVSYERGGFYFYLGWRNRGNFGFEFKFSEPREVGPSPKSEIRAVGKGMEAKE